MPIFSTYLNTCRIGKGALKRIAKYSSGANKKIHKQAKKTFRKSHSAKSRFNPILSHSWIINPRTRDCFSLFVNLLFFFFLFLFSFFFFFFFFNGCDYLQYSDKRTEVFLLFTKLCHKLPSLQSCFHWYIFRISYFPSIYPYHSIKYREFSFSQSSIVTYTKSSKELEPKWEEDINDISIIDW